MVKLIIEKSEKLILLNVISKEKDAKNPIDKIVKRFCQLDWIYNNSGSVAKLNL